MENIANTPTTMEVVTELIYRLISSPFLFIIIVMVIYIFLPKLKRESVNNEVIKLIRAIKGSKSA